jgi:hypothetical protein
MTEAQVDRLLGTLETVIATEGTENTEMTTS